MAVADLAQSFDVARRRHDQAVGTGDRLDEHRGDSVAAFIHDRLFDLVEAALRELLLAVAFAIEVAAVLVRIEEADDARHARLVRPAARIAGQRDRAGRRAVIRAIADHDLLPSGDHLRDADRVLVRLGAAEGEEEAVEITGREVGQHLAEARAHGRRHSGTGVRELLGLRLDRLDDALVTVADVHAHELRVHVDVALAVGIPEVDAFAAHHRDRIDAPLRRPGKNRVAFGEGDNLLRCHRTDGICNRHSRSPATCHPERSEGSAT